MTGRKKQSPKGDLRRRVMRAARQLFSELGYINTNTRMIAKKAGTSETGIYRLFSDGNGKYELLVAVYDECWQEINEAIEFSQAVERPDPRIAIRTTVHIFWEECENNPQLAMLILKAWAVDPRLSRMSKESHKYVDHIAKLCRKCVDLNMVDKNVTATALTEVILGISEGIPRGWYFPRAPEAAQHRVSLVEATMFIDSVLGYRREGI